MNSARRVNGAAIAAAVIALMAIPCLASAQARLTISGASSTVVGAGVDLTIEAYDGSGNIDATYNGNKVLTFSGAIASPNPSTNPTVSDKNGIGIPFGAGTQIMFSSGVATVSGLTNGVMTLYRARTDTISVTDGTLSTLTPGDKLVITATASALGKFTLVLISPQFNGLTFTGSNTLTAQDIYGNTVKTFDASLDNVTLSALSPLSGTITGLGTGNNNVLNRSSDFVQGVATLNLLGMKYTGTIGTGAFTAISSSGKSGVSSAITISAGSATRLVITGSAAQTAGASQSLTITAKDAANNTVTAYAGDKSLTFSGASASANPVTQPTVSDKNGVARAFGTATTIAFTGGVAAVSGSNNGVMRLYRAGTDTVAVTDGTVSSAGTDRLVVTVSVGAQTQFGVALASPQTSGVVFTGTNQIVAQDAYGNSVGSYDASANNVTVVANAPLSGSVTGLGTSGLNVLNRASDFVGGVANLTSLGMKYLGSSGTGTFSVSSGTGATGTSNAVTIGPGGAVRLAFIQQPSGADANAVISPPVTVQLRDTSNNSVAQAGVAVTLSLSSGTGVLSGTLTRTTSAAGLATFDDLKVSQSGTKQLRASSAGLTPATSSNFTIAASLAPAISVWYGKDMTFRKAGVPQRWANVFGNVTDPDGIKSLTYSLNGGPQVNLTVGPDTRRLVRKGDFNVDLAWAQLNPSPSQNTVIITATDSLNNVSRDTVTVRYVTGTRTSIPYRVAWAGPSSLLDSAQVVDGLWSVDAGGLLTIEPGYDRLVAVGDTTWTDYEVTVPITVHEIDSSGYSAISGRPVVGLFMRWKGHSDDPIAGWQPKQGWKPFGAGGFYAFEKPTGKLEIYPYVLDYSGKRVQLGIPYYYKMRVETTPTGHLYKLKVWQVGLTEPAAYDLTHLRPLSETADGSFLLLAHHVRATFGAVSVAPITGDGIPPVVSDISTVVGRTSAEIRWTTNELAVGRVDYGPTTSYGATLEKDSLAMGQSFLLTGLTENTLYHYRITATDPSGNPKTESDRFFVTKGSSSLSSDDFNASTLNTALWSYVDPVGDGSVGMTGTQVSLSVPAGQNHDAYTGPNTTPRILQTINDTDFDVEVKLDAPMTTAVQGSGLIVQADPSNYLRFDVYTDGTKLYAFAATIVNDAGAPRANVDIGSPGTAPAYLRLQRERNVWTYSYSPNGSAWETISRFTYDAQINAIGLYTANFGSPAPAYSSLADYFRNTQTPRLRANVKVMLQGPYNDASGVMSTALRASGALAVRYPGRPIPATAVDSVNIEIRNSASAASSTVRRFAPAWLLRDGTIRDMTDTSKSYVEYDEQSGGYYLVVRQANHVAVMTAEPQLLSVGSAALYDFTSGLQQAYGPASMKLVSTAGPPRYALFAGNAAATDHRVNAADRLVVKRDLGKTGYQTADLNLDGVVTSQDAGIARTNTGSESIVP